MQVDDGSHVFKITAARGKVVDQRDQLTINCDKLQRENGQLNHILKAWTVAVDERDKALKNANEDILALAK